MSPETISLTNADESEVVAPPVLCELTHDLEALTHLMDEIDLPRADYVIGLVINGATRKSWDFAITTAREILARVNRKAGSAA